jgi:hypothetical protein
MHISSFRLFSQLSLISRERRPWLVGAASLACGSGGPAPGVIKTPSRPDAPADKKIFKIS